MSQCVVSVHVHVSLFHGTLLQEEANAASFHKLAVLSCMHVLIQVASVGPVV